MTERRGLLLTRTTDPRRDRQAAGGTADLSGSVTWAEVLAMPSLLRGRAAYHEVLHPIPGPTGGGARVVTDHYHARGVREDGRQLTMLVAGQNRPEPGQPYTVDSYRLHVWQLQIG